MMRMGSNVAPTFCMQVPVMLSILYIKSWILLKKERSGLNKKNNNSLLSDEIFQDKITKTSRDGHDDFIAYFLK